MEAVGGVGGVERRGEGRGEGTRGEGGGRGKRGERRGEGGGRRDIRE